jgi:hypothetical protein
MASPVLALYKTTFAPETAEESVADFTIICITVGGGGSTLLSSLHPVIKSITKPIEVITKEFIIKILSIIFIPFIKWTYLFQKSNHSHIIFYKGKGNFLIEEFVKNRQVGY